MYTLKNNHLRIKINTLGAELVSVINDDYEYLWQADPKFWNKTSPILFPIVGRLANDAYFIDNERFEMPQHGFARDMDFELLSESQNEIWFRIVDTPETKKMYPFEFELRVGYRLEENRVMVLWEVINNSDVSMPFSIGAHPGFNADPELEDYALQMTVNKDISTRFIDNGKFVELRDDAEKIIEGLPFLPLNKDFFKEYPTLVLEGESEITLRSYYDERAVDVIFEDFPLVGIWSPINSAGDVAPFVCIEPWFGIADISQESGDLRGKFGINVLEPATLFKAQYEMIFR